MTIEGPDRLRYNSAVDITCNALGTYIPFNFTLNITSGDTNLLVDLESNGLIEINPAIYTPYKDENGYSLWNMTQVRFIYEFDSFTWLENDFG